MPIAHRIPRPGGPRRRAQREGKAVFIEGALPASGSSARRTASKPKLRRRRASRAVLQRARGAARAALPATSASAAAAPCSTSTRARRSRPSSACWRTACGTSARCGRRRCCRRSTARPGATGTARASRCATCRRRAARWSASASAGRPTSPTCTSCEVLPPRVSALIPAAARAGRRAVDPRAAAADRSGGGRRRRRCWCSRILVPLTARRTRRCCAHSPTRTACRSGCSRAGRTPPRRSIRRRAARSTTRCPSSTCGSRFLPTDFTQVNHAVNGVLVSPRAAAARPAARRAHRRPVLRPGQLHAADRARAARR